eukprot:TRINITY_DN3137_c0_g4_i5.p1 TRINITY_DN3137_c0_g4~~TRINITY_DN3137_c0_g4_i5.p1  ORF type:complete len:100 (+),score=6.41 TRINITY_DN3137_c0_g4_i5:358-657(+)
MNSFFGHSFFFSKERQTNRFFNVHPNGSKRCKENYKRGFVRSLVIKEEYKGLRKVSWMIVSQMLESWRLRWGRVEWREGQRVVGCCSWVFLVHRLHFAD